MEHLPHRICAPRAGRRLIDQRVELGVEHEVVRADLIEAEVDGELTLKILAKDKDGYWLQPANPAYAPIRAREKLEISGVMVGLIRKL